jgi:hypothetical protein
MNITSNPNRAESADHVQRSTKREAQDTDRAKSVTTSIAWLTKSLAAEARVYKFSAPAPLPQKKTADQIVAAHGLPPADDIAAAETDVPADPNNPDAGNLTVAQAAIQDLMKQFDGYIMKGGTVTTEGSIVKYKLESGAELSVDTARLKTDRAKDIFSRLVSGGAVSEADLQHLESDDGSEDLFEGDDWDTWMTFAERVPESDPRREFALVLQAQGALSQGYNLLPYTEEPGWFGSTHRTYPGGEDNPTFQAMSPADVGAILDADSIDARMSELLKDPTVIADYQAAIARAAQHIPDAAARAESLYTTLTSTEFKGALKELNDSGYADEATTRLQAYLVNLSALDPVKAQQAAQDLSISALGSSFNELAADPSQIGGDTFNQATTDTLAIIIQSLRSGSGIVRHGSQLTADLIKYLDTVQGDAVQMKNISSVMQALLQERQQLGVPLNAADDAARAFTAAEVETALDKLFIPADQRAGVLGFFTKMQRSGLWGTFGGMATIASFGYKLSQGAWGPDSTPLERWGAARDIFSFLSVTNHITRTASVLPDAFKQVSSLVGCFFTHPANIDASLKSMGFDAGTINEIFQGPRPSTTAPLTAQQIELATVERASTAQLAETLTPQTQGTGTALDAMSGSGAAVDVATAVEESTAANTLLQQIKRNPATDPFFAFDGAAVSSVKRGVLAGLRVIGTVTDLAGIADIVVNAIGLKRAVDAGDVAGQIAGATGVVGGAALTVAGTIGTAQLFGAGGAIGGALASTIGAAAFGLGVVVTLAGFIASSIYSAVKRHNDLQRASDDQGAWFHKLADAGLAAQDWDDRLEYLRYAYATYGNDNTDPSKSYFDVQAAEWQHFQQTPGEGGSSNNRLSEELHVKSDKTWVIEDTYDDFWF